MKADNDKGIDLLFEKFLAKYSNQNIYLYMMKADTFLSFGW